MANLQPETTNQFLTFAVVREDGNLEIFDTSKNSLIICADSAQSLQKISGPIENMDPDVKGARIFAMFPENISEEKIRQAIDKVKSYKNNAFSKFEKVYDSHQS